MGGAAQLLSLGGDVELNFEHRKDTMNKDRIAQNLAAVENHFHSEELAEVEAALQTFTAISFGKPLPRMA